MAWPWGGSGFGGLGIRRERDGTGRRGRRSDWLAEASTMVMERLEPRLLLSDTPFGTVLASDTAPATIKDVDGTELQIVLTGAGHWQLTQGNPGQSPILTVTDTTATSTLTFLTSAGGDGRFTLGKLAVQGSVRAITGAKTDLAGDLSVSGSLGSSVLGNVTGPSSVTVDGGGAIAKVVFGIVRDMNLRVAGGIGTLSVQGWAATGGVDNSVVGTSIGLLQSAGDFNASFALSGTGAAGRVLTSASIDGAIGASVWSVRGSVGQISAGTVAQGWRGNIAGAMSQFVTSGDFRGQLAVAVLNSLAVGGNLANAAIAVGADLGADARVGGTGASADTFGQGILANVRITGGISNSAIRVGVDPKDGIYDNGNDSFYAVGSQIQQLFVGGSVDSSSAIEATSLPATVRIGGVAVDPLTDSRFRSTPVHHDGVRLTGALAVDTGDSAVDRLTSNPAIAGTASDAGGRQAIATLKAGLDGAAVGAYVDLLATLPSDGAFQLSRAALDAMAGGTLGDGAHVLHLLATNASGVASSLDVSFTLDTTPPATPRFDLDTASDTGTAGDHGTSLATVTLVGTTAAGTTVRLSELGRSTVANSQGAFAFADVALAEGDNGFTAVAIDAAGNSASFALTVRRTAAGAGLAAALRSDTGVSAVDGITRDPAIAGTIALTGSTTVASFRAGFDGAATANYVDIGAAVSGSGFTLDRAALDRIAGGTLAQGAHVLHLVLADSGGGVSRRDVAFTLDTVAPGTPVFDLAQTDKVGTADHQTRAAAASITGTADAGSVVTLGSASTVASTGGTFRFDSVALALGDTALSVTATDAAGNTSTATLTVTRLAATTSADAAIQWVRTTLQAIANDGSMPEFASRAIAMEGIAAYDVINAINGSPGYLVSMAAPAGASAEAAIAAAGHAILSYLYPAQQAALDALYAQSLNAIADGQAKTDGMVLGTAIANRVIAIRLLDGFDKFVTYEGSTELGKWRPTGPVYDIANNPQWATLTPFALTSPDQFRPAGITVALTSQDYADVLNQVKSLGALTGSTRTADQTQIARFWALGIGTYTPPGGWTSIATQIAVAKGLSLAQNAKLFAQLGVALADSAIAAWDAKYAYGTWRPETAIHEADKLGNASLAADPNWKPFLITPAHPDYVSGHSTFSGAAATILAATFGDNTSFTTGSSSLVNVTRSFTSFSQAADEAGMSRIYGGIHTDFANQDGKTLGKKVAAWALQSFDLSQDKQAPKLVLNQESGLATNRALVVTGTITDQLSGVASLTVAIDGGDARAVGFDAKTGAFSVSTNLKLDGTADGAHSLVFRATDAAGNALTPTSFGLTLVTRAPTVTLSTGSVTEGAALDPTGSYLIGTATPAAGRLAGLTYRIDNGTVVPMSFDANGAFATTLDLSKVGIGAHVVTLAATDLAGNVTTRTLNVSLAALAPLTVTGITPADGAGDIGVTYRPKVSFSRAVSASTLTSDSFYATDSAGAVVASRVVIADDHKSAFLFFANALPGSSRITVHVEGSEIRGEADGAFLDAAGSGRAGTDLTSSFTSVSTSTVANTSIVGTVLDPGPDLQPMTYDDVRGGPDQRVHTADDVYLNPLAHVKVFILGRENEAVYTDAAGKFTLTNVPVGNVKIELDGRTATNAATGFFFPSMVMDTTIRPGIANTLMGSMGSEDVQEANDGYPVVYLPRVPTNILQPVSTTAVTTITAMQGASAATRVPITDEQREQIRLEVQPGSILDADGNPLANATVGISTVPAALVKDMLPEGLMQHTFDITIQAPGASVFTTPATLTMPNVFGLAPGEKTYVLSFDHTTGKLVIDGTATVSADGKTVTTDPGQGVTQPGWHGVTPAGSWAKASTPADGPPDRPWSDITNILNNEYQSLKGKAGEILAYQALCIAMDACENSNTWGNGWVKNVFNQVAQDSLNRQNGTLPKNAIDLFYPGYGTLLDLTIDNVPNNITIPIFRNTVNIGQFLTPIQGFGRHFAYELVPSFWNNASDLHNQYTTSDGRMELQHDGFFRDAVLKCFEEMANMGLLSHTAADIAKFSVPKVAAALRESIYYTHQGYTDVVKFIDDIYDGDLLDRPFYSGKIESLAGIEQRENLVGKVSISASDMFSNTIASAGDLAVTLDKFFVDVGSSSQINVKIKNTDGSLSDITGSKDIKYYFVSDKGAITISDDGILSALLTQSLFSIAPSQAYVVAVQANHVGIGQLAIIDRDRNSNLISDSMESKIKEIGIPANSTETFKTISQYSLDRQNRGYLYYSIENIASGDVIRGVTNQNGEIEGVFLPELQKFKVTYLNPSNLSIGDGFFVSDKSGNNTQISAVNLKVDQNNTGLNGLSEKASYVLGVDNKKSDNLVSGVTDLAALQAGLTENKKLASSTGVISTLGLKSAALSIAVANDPANFNKLTAYIAEGGAGFAIIDVTNSNTPKTLSQTALGVPVNDVAVDVGRSVAALTGASGLVLVDISSTSAPRVLQTVALGDTPTRVALRDGIAYVAAGAEITTVNILTGDILQTFAARGTALTDLTFDGDTLFTFDTNHTLRAFTLTGETITARGTLDLPKSGNADGTFPQSYGAGQITAGGGIVYVEAGNGGVGGFLTVDVRNPDTLVLKSDVDKFGIAGTAMALNGSGLGVAVGSSNFVFGGFQGLDVLNVSDPTNTGQFVTRINLPSPANDVAIANGIAFVADGASGLQIVNYLGFDTKGKAPTITADVRALDRDATKAGIQVVEGDLIHISPTITDDVQVRNVQLRVNDTVVENDPSYPFTFSTLAPAIASGGTAMKIEVIATDTGGNSATSTPITLEVVKDTFPPTVVKTSVAANAKLFFVRSVDVTFDSPLNVAKLDPAGVSLVHFGADGTLGTADDTRVAVALDTRANGQIVSVRPTSYLLPGSYRLTMAAGGIVDYSGNAATTPVTLDFTIRPASNIRAASGAAAVAQAPSANPGQAISIPVPFDAATAYATFRVVDQSGNQSTQESKAFSYDAAKGIASFLVPYEAITGEVQIYGKVGSTKTPYDDGTFLLQIVPVVTGIGNVSLNGDGTATVTLAGYGFVEGNGSSYQFGATAIADPNGTTGPNVYTSYQNGYIANSRVDVQVPVSAASFGSIVVTTSGGVSGVFSSGLAGVEGVALSGVPADAGKASANPGQSVVVSGTGLSTASEIVLTYVDAGGGERQVLLNPVLARSDGTQATVAVPVYANGAFALRMFGASAAPVLQVVPVVASASGNGNTLALSGAGFVEGATTVVLPGASVVDTQVNAGADIAATYVNGIYVQSGALSVAEPQHGLGAVTVTTAGGTSAAAAIATADPDLDGLGDVAADTAAGTVWVLSSASPAVLSQIEVATGAVVKSVALPAGTFGATYGYYGGLQVAPAALTLGTTAVAKGSLLLFSGYANPDRVLAINPATGGLVASLALGANHDLTGGVYDPASGHLFGVARASGRLVELNAQTGAEIARFDLPWAGGHAGLALDPATGNLWYGSDGSRTVALLDRTGKVLRQVDLSVQGFAGAITGLAFDAGGRLLVSESGGAVFRADLAYDPAVLRPVLGAITGMASEGTPAQGAVASANVGQTITLAGSNFAAGTVVVFQTRDNAGRTGTTAVAPAAIAADGRTLQVVVPGLATTGNVRVVNVGSANLGYNGSYADAIYRKVTLSFTPTAATSVIRFADTGLEALGNESWGIDNVLVTRGGTSVFQDTFEGGAKAEWSDATTDNTAAGVFSQFSGRFNNGEQLLTLGGLTAGQSYTLTFDLYVLDSWDGDSASNGPDRFEVSADGTLLMREAFGNYLASGIQTYNASAGVRLQVVPTLSGVSGRPGTGTLSSYDLIGSGFQAGASTITVGGVATPEPYTNQNGASVSGAANGAYRVTTGLSVEGPIRITTEGGYAQLAGPAFAAQPPVTFAGIQASAAAGVAANAAQPSANTGQQITLTGQGFTSSTLVQFAATDDTGVSGTLTRTGSAGSNGTTLTVTVPALARTGLVRVLGTDQAYQLQVVPVLRAVGGTVAAGRVIELEGTGLNPAELQVQVDGIGAGGFTVRTLADPASTSYVGQQILTVTVPAGVGAGQVTVSTRGGNAAIRTGAASTTLAAVSPGADVGDTIATAAALTLPGNSRVTINATTANGTQANLDVDLYAVTLAAGDQLTYTTGSTSQYSYLRVFNAAGTALLGQYVSNSSTGQWTAPGAGTYYIGVSGYYNTGYDPAKANSGNASGYIGAYQLTLDRRAADSTVLTGITATAGQGVPAQGGVASANTGQTITLTGSGLASSDRIVFLVDNYGNGFSTTTAAPASVAADGTSLTVAVPVNAVTGAVRLAREQAGVLLQVVPTVSAINLSTGTYVGQQVTLTGTGFSPSSGSVRFGTGAPVDESYYYYYNTNTQAYVSVPNGAATGPITVTTVGGTSNAIQRTFTGIEALATTGTAADAARASANPGQLITLRGTNLTTATAVVFQTIDSAGNRTDLVQFSALAAADGTSLQIAVPLNAVSGTMRIVGDTTNTGTPLQIVPVVTGIGNVSLNGDGTATLTLTGTGFEEGNATYRIGNTTIRDRNTGVGPDVYAGYLNGNYIQNSAANVTVPLGAASVGSISVTNGGGTSAVFSGGLTGITATATSGTPADAIKASANPGQTITLTGTGLSTTVPIVLTYIDSAGSKRWVVLNPTAAATDGSSATLTVPLYANGAFPLQMFGASAAPVLQVVPVLSAVTSSGAQLQLSGAGFVEGATTVMLPGATVVDTEQADGADIGSGYDPVKIVYFQNGSISATEPQHGLGSVIVTTAGGTATAVALDTAYPALASLGDVATDKIANTVWTIANDNQPGLAQIDLATGATLRTISLPTATFGDVTGYYSGLQVAPAALTLGTTAVAKGSLLLFSGSANPDRVIAINPVTGALIASLALGANHDLTGGLYDPTSAHLFIAARGSGKIVEINPANGAQIASFTPPNGIGLSGLAIDPTTGNLWYGSDSSRTIALLDRTGKVLRQVDLSVLGVQSGSISGLAFDSSGRLLVSTSAGTIVRMTLPSA